MSVCVQLFGSLLVNKGWKHPLTATCLSPLAIFSDQPCQGPHIYPPTVGSSSLRYNSPWQTMVINPCRLFIQPVKNTCSPRSCQQRLTCQKYTTRGNVVRYLVGSGTTRWLPGALQLGWTVWSRHASPKSCFKANQHLCFYLPLFILTHYCDQSNCFKATLQTSTCTNTAPSTILQLFTNNHDWWLFHPLSELVLYSRDLLYLDFFSP